jgi:hypothetical protein
MASEPAGEKKKVGRPPRYAPGKRPILTIRLQEKLYNKIKEEAAKTGRSLSEEIERRVEQALEEDDEKETLREAATIMYNTIKADEEIRKIYENNVDKLKTHIAILERNQERTEQVLSAAMAALEMAGLVRTEAASASSSTPAAISPRASASPGSSESVSAEAGQKVEGILGSFKDASSSPTSDDEEPQS